VSAAEGKESQQQQQQQQQVRKLAQGRRREVSAQKQQQQQQQQQGPFNIWDHSSGDSGSVVELFPMEIRTWLITLGQS
jgi:hypothetical protein